MERWEKGFFAVLIALFLAMFGALGYVIYRAANEPRCVRYERVPCDRSICIDPGVKYCHEYKRVTERNGACLEWDR